jgi:N-acetylglucosamine kinase-like BadF-type ATPase
MGKLIADSGSTKTSWLLTDGPAGAQSFQTSGINPYQRSSEDIYRELLGSLRPGIPGPVDELFFYGAGIVNQERGDVVKQALARLFPVANIETHSDLLGASRALFGTKAGIVCIMGTGSNSCLYDGEKIAARVPSLGFILGDECSGAVLGKKLLSDYLRKIMPIELQVLFERQDPVTEDEVLGRVYRTERPNKYLAGFAPFLSKNLSQPYCLNMVKTSLAEFFERNVLQLPDAARYPIGFVGSVAFAFSTLIEEMAASYGFSKPFILKDPIVGLKEFHSK